MTKDHFEYVELIRNMTLRDFMEHMQDNKARFTFYQYMLEDLKSLDPTEQRFQFGFCYYIRTEFRQGIYRFNWTIVTPELSIATNDQDPTTSTWGARRIILSDSVRRLQTIIF